MDAKPVPIERRKLVYDYAKHLTTLNAGSLVVLVAFFEKLNDKPTLTRLLACSLVLFVLSMLTAAFTQFMTAALVDSEKLEESEATIASGALVASMVAFVLAIGSLAGFAIVNLP